MLYIGGPGVHLFAFVMVVGVIVGTYSSIYIASPLLLMFGEGKHEEATPQGQGAKGAAARCRGANGIEASYSDARRLIRKALIFGMAILWPSSSSPLYYPTSLGQSTADVAPAIQWLAFISVMRCVHWFLADALSGANAQILRTSVQVGIALFNIGLNLVVLPRWSWIGAAWTKLSLRCSAHGRSFCCSAMEAFCRNDSRGSACI